jgi:hypothetical protein
MDDDDDPAPWMIGLADRLAEYVIWQTLFAQDIDDLDDIDTAQVWTDVIERLEIAIDRIWARWDAAKKRPPGEAA